MKSVKRLSRYTSILLSVLLMLSAMSPGITALAQEKANAAPTVLNYEDDSIKAELKAAEGDALPTGAALQVKALNKDSQDETEKALYAETEAGLNAKAAGQGTAVNGFIAYSVQLQDKDGKNVTPEKGSFTLKITYKNPDAPEAYQKSQSTEKGVTLYQKTEGKDEQNNTIYTMEPTQEDSTQITADENGKVQSAESKLTTLEPVAVTWESVPQVTIDNEDENTQGSENTALDQSQLDTAAQPSLMAGSVSNKKSSNQYTYSFDLPYYKNWDCDYFENWMVSLVDRDGKPLNIENNSAEKTLGGQYPSAKVEDIAPQISGYSFRYAQVTYPDGNKNKTSVFKAVAPWNTNTNKPNTGKYQYHYKYNNDTSLYKDTIEKDDDEYKTQARIHFVYAKVESLIGIDTVDSASQGVDIQMYDYASATPNKSWGGYGDGTIKKGLLERELQEIDGEYLPVSAKSEGNMKKGDPLTDSFSTRTANYKGNANNLFSKSVFDNPESLGTYYYSSFDNYAYWNKPADNQGTGDFTVYNQLGTPSDDNAYFYKRGNFMPYNQIGTKGFSTNSNLYDENGNSLNESAPRYNEPLYKTDGTNYEFGMVITANFAQLENGQYNNKPMVYEFNGDDDMWVFIDGVLVLDIGGIHDAHSGSIDFSTGVVSWYDCKTGKTPQEETTTIKKQFVEAKGEQELKDQDWNGNTFADYTGHEIKIFYMERGAGASNCKMSFNLPVVPKDSVTVEKEVTNINQGSYSNVNFNFKLYLEDENADPLNEDTITDSNGTKYSLQKGRDYQLIEGSTTQNELKTDTATGVFTLHHGQKAQFANIAEKGTQYIIQEVDVEQDHYDEFTVNGQAKDENGNALAILQDGKYIIQTMPLTIGKNLHVRVENTCAASNEHSLEITKKMAEGQSSDEVYKVQVKIGGQLFKGEYQIVKDGVASDMKKSDDGIISVRADETIRIEKIAAGTGFEVSEIELDSEKYEIPKYTINPEDYNNDITTINENGIYGSVIYGHNAQVTVTNTEKLGSLKITKMITDDSKVDYNDGDPIFTFKITGPLKIEGQEPMVLYRTLRLSETVGKSAYVIVDNLPVGEYQVEELSTMRYTCQSENPQTATVEQNNTDATQNVAPADFVFTNNLTNKDYFSHTDVVENSFKIGEDGTVTVEKHKVPEGQVPDGTTPVQPSNE